MLGVGAWLQYQQREMLQRNERHLASSKVSSHLWCAFSSPPPLHQLCSPPPSAAAGGSLPLSITLGAGGGWQREAAQLQPPAATFLYLKLFIFKHLGLCTEADDVTVLVTTS